MIHKKRWLKHQDANQTLFFTACGLIMADLKEGDQAIPRLKTTQGGVPIEVDCEDCLRVANLERLRPDIKCSNCGVIIMPQVQKRERMYPRNRLSNREAEITAHLLTGAKSKDIGKTLFITEKTVKFHSTAIYRKLKVSGRTELSHMFHSNQLDIVSMELIKDYYKTLETPQMGEVPMP
jgi:DNA-binding CsgD family transcriptional regulator